MNIRLPMAVTVVIAVVIAGCVSGDDPTVGTGDVVAAPLGTTPPTTQVPTATEASPGEPVGTPNTSAGGVVPDSVATTVQAGCEPATPGPLVEARRSPASPYFVRHPAEGSGDTPTVMFIPGGSTGTREAAKRVWANYLSDGDGVDDFRIVIPYAVEFDLYDDEDRILAIVDEVLACYGGDPLKFHIAGYSRGGQIAFDLMLRRPELFATVLGAPGEFLLVDPERWREELADKAVFNGVERTTRSGCPS